MNTVDENTVKPTNNTAPIPLALLKTLAAEPKLFIQKWSNQHTTRWTITLDLIDTPALHTSVLKELAEVERQTDTLTPRQRADLIAFYAEVFFGARIEVKPLGQP